jgi:hypothetical protein
MVRNNYIKIRDGKVEALLDVLFYVKEKVVYAYAPALDLVGYDYSEDGAKKSLNVVLEDFFRFGIQRNTLEKDLLEHGWVKEIRKKEEYEVPNIWAVVSNNKEIQKLKEFNKRSFPFSSNIAAC